MFIMIYTDGDSSIYDLNKNKLKESIWGNTYIISLNTENDIEEFINSWETNAFNLSDKVFSSLNYFSEDIKYCLENNISDKFENGNYYFKIFNELNLNKVK